MIVRYLKMLLCWHRWSFEELISLPRRIDLWGDEVQDVAHRERCAKCEQRREVYL